MTELRYGTTCKLCGHEFDAPAFTPTINNKPDPRIEKFGRMLFTHIADKHPQQMQGIAMILQSFTGFLGAQFFNCPDPVILDMQEDFRSQLHQRTRLNNVDDQQIRDRLTALTTDEENPLPLEFIAPLEFMFRDFRDMLTEAGRYAPDKRQKPLVTAV